MLKKTRNRVGSLSFIGVLLLNLIPALAVGETMRCGSQLIMQGTSQAKVAALCGQPAQVVRPAAAYGVDPGATDAENETWVYNFGPNRFMQKIRFRNGVVAGIASVGYGY